MLPFGFKLSFLVSSTLEVFSCRRSLSFGTGFSIAIAFGSSFVFEGACLLNSYLKASDVFKNAKSAVDPAKIIGFVFFAVMLPRVLLGLMLSSTCSSFWGALNNLRRLSVLICSWEGASGLCFIFKVGLTSGLFIQFSWSVCSCSV